MLTTPVRESGSQPMISGNGNEVYYTREEFMDELAKQLGQAYGLNDIREDIHRIMPQSMIIL